jgi:hypothetical protein
MNTNNFIIEDTTRFAGNGGSFNEQPLWVLAENLALTGSNWVSLMRLRTERTDAASGVLCLKIGSSAGIQSFTGAQEIYANSISSNGSATAPGNEYIITHVLNSFSKHNVIVNDANNLLGDITVTGQEVLPSLNTLGTGFRPLADTLPTDGSTGKALALYYTFNREELGSSLTSVADRSGNSLTAKLKGSTSGNGLSATVTGWSYSPCEGGFRLDGDGWIESNSSSLFSLTSAVSGGYSVLINAKFALTSNSQLFSIGASGTEELGVYEKNGLLTVKVGLGTLSAAIESGIWYQIGVTIDTTTASTSGTALYLNGSSVVVSGNMNYFPTTINNDGRLVIGKDQDLTNSGMTGAVGMTRIFTRSLSASEVMLNYLGTIPSMTVKNSLKIG